MSSTGLAGAQVCEPLPGVSQHVFQQEVGISSPVGLLPRSSRMEYGQPM